jgi:hypothetical protein
MAENNPNFDAEYEKLKNSKFKQQKLPAWRPVPTITSTTITFTFFGVIFIVIGIVVLLYSNQIVEVSFRYDDQGECPIGEECAFTLDIPKDMTLPVMVYYQLNNFYQNHRRYVKSKSDAQLRGQVLTASQLESECDPIITMKDLGLTNFSKDGTVLLNDTYNAVANPCGLIAKSFFNDTFTLWDNNNNNIKINDTGIAWEADKEIKYARPPNWEQIQWIDPTDEHFIVWMRPAGLPNFKKLWGRVQAFNGPNGASDVLPQGKYVFKVKNHYPVSMFKGEKYFVLSTVNSFGGKNSFLGISYLVVGSLCIVMAIVFLIGYKIHNKRKEN